MAARGQAGRYIVFQLDRQYFAIRAEYVIAVLAAKDVMPSAEENDSVLGVVKVDGRTVPVLDLYERLGLRGPDPAPGSAILALRLNQHSVAIEVDVLSQVLDVRERDIRNGVIQLRSNGRPYGRPKTLLDVEALFSGTEVDRLPWTA